MLKGNLLYFLYAAVAGAIGIGGYFVVPKLIDRTQVDKPAIVETQPADSGKTDRPAAAEPEAAQEMAKIDSEAVVPDVVVKPVIPGFDIVRVEPDGSMLIAGFGTPNSKMEVVDNEAAIASTQVGTSGSFVAVLDEPLPPGDYVFRLRNTLADGSIVVSADAATISVPEEPGGQLLAMVGKPGEASRILTQPVAKGAEPAQKEVAELASEPVEKVEEVGVGVTLPELPAGSLEILGKPPTIIVEAEQVEQVEQVEQAEQGKQAEQADQANRTEEAAPLVETVQAEEETVQAEESEAAVEPAGEVEIAAVDPDSAKKEEVPAEPAVERVIRVDAVEIEGDKIFVAGAATPDFSVKVLADDAEIGTARVADNGRFIVESSHQLAVGEHKIAAELLSPDSNEVVLRVVVPFVRPEGDRMAAVAPNETDRPGEPVTSETEAEPEPQTANAEAPTKEEIAPAGGAADEAKTVSQAALEPAVGSVIIRRGDTLWQISRRTYGQGVRYTTIYLANQQQIVDPDRISPGQVFKVPDTPEPISEAERIHHELLKGQKPGSN